MWGRWTYMTTSDTKIGASIYIYSGAAAADKSKTVVLGTALSGAAVIRAISSGGDCVLSTIGSPTTEVNLHKVDASGITLIDNAFNVITSGTADITDANLASLDTNFIVATGCVAFRAFYNSKYYMYVKSAPNAAAGSRYTKATNFNTDAIDTFCVFDPAFKFSINAGKVTGLNPAGTDYIDTAVTDYGDIGAGYYRLWLSSDSKTLLFLSFTPTDGTTAKVFYLKFFNFIGSAWAPTDASTNKSSLLLTDSAFNAPRVFFTPTMDAVAITYKKTSLTGGSTTLIFKLTISTVGFSSYTLPSADFNTAINLAQQFLYFDDTTSTTYLQLINVATIGPSQ